MAIGFLLVLRLRYLLHDCPVDLSGDEAQYWDWSRRLGWCYYSKGPVIAYIIRASCAIFGDVMPAVRLPALLFNAATMVVTYDSTRRLFRSERLALGAALLMQLMPIMVVGGYLITIDPPLFFFWALATDLLAIALFEQKRWPWPVLGLVIGAGSLTKYAMLLYLPLAGAAMLLDIDGRRLLKSAGPWIATIVGVLCLTPVVVWNQRHDWVSLRHVAHQTGAAGGRWSQGNTLVTIGGQIGAVGPAIAVLMAAGFVHAWRTCDRRALFLSYLGIGFLLFNLLDSFTAEVQQNWPAPAYFSLAIVAAWFVGECLAPSPGLPLVPARRGEGDSAGGESFAEPNHPHPNPLPGYRERGPEQKIILRWRVWAGWLYAAIAIGIGTMIVSRDPTMLFPIARPILRNDLAIVDLLSRLRGWRDCGQRISDDLATMPAGSFVLCDDYQQTAEMAFYVRGQPTTYCAGPYLGARLSQYDLWPDHRLDRTSPLVGHDALYLGKGGPIPPQLQSCFSSIERLNYPDIIVRGVVVKTFRAWRCRNFKGFDAITASRPASGF